jgi:hypothetical protein
VLGALPLGSQPFGHAVPYQASATNLASEPGLPNGYGRVCPARSPRSWRGIRASSQNGLAGLTAWCMLEGLWCGWCQGATGRCRAALLGRDNGMQTGPEESGPVRSLCEQRVRSWLYPFPNARLLSSLALRRDTPDRATSIASGFASPNRSRIPSALMSDRARSEAIFSRRHRGRTVPEIVAARTDMPAISTATVRWAGPTGEPDRRPTWAATHPKGLTVLMKRGK